VSISEEEVVLEVNDLRTHIFDRTSVVKAVDGVSFFLRKGETLGIGVGRAAARP
jgi:peptide/nickel transport system ATP-binding protein